MREKISELKENEDVPALINILEKGDKKERAEAAKALGMIGASGALPILLEKAEKDKEGTVRANSILALSHYGFDSVEKIFKEACEDDDWKVKHDVAIAMRSYGEKFKEELYSLIEDDEIEVRKKAIESLGIVGSKDDIQKIAEYVENERLKKVAVEAISRIGSEKAIDILTDVYSEEDQNIRELAVKGAGKINDERSLSLLIEALEDESWRIREEAANFLGKLENKKAISPLLERLDDENFHVLEASIRSLSKIDGEDVLKEIINLYDHRSPEVRIAITDALINISEDVPSKFLINFLESEENPRVLWSLSDALVGLSRENLKKLEKKLSSLEDEKRIFLLVGLAKTGKVIHPDELISTLESDRWKVRQKVIEALEEIDIEELSNRNRKKILKKLKDRLNDNDKWVRARAVKTASHHISRLDEELSEEETKRLKEEIYRLKEMEMDEDVLEEIKKAQELIG